MQIAHRSANTMSFVPLFVTFLCILNAISSQIINPTTINSTSSFYIASEHYNNFAQYYQSSTIICNSTFCHIICDVSSSCDGLTVYATSSLTTLVIQCLQSSSCNQAIINADNINSVSLNCSYGTSTATAACSNLDLYASNVSTASIYCSTYACYSANAQFGNIRNNVTVTCDGQYACREATFNASYIGTSVTMSCSGEYSCYGTNIYCPRNYTCDIDCTSDSSYSCRSIRMHIDKYTLFDNKLSLHCSTSTTTSCESSRIICDDSSSSTALQYNSGTSSWQCNRYSCCPIGIGSFTCTPGVPCQIDCSTQTCTNYHIDATLASSLTVYCGGAGCQGAWIECPTVDYASCNIQCDEYPSCGYAYVTYFHQFELNCNERRACEYMHLSLNSGEINYFNLSCYGSYSCQYMEASLNSAQINYFNLSSGAGTRSFQYAKFSATIGINADISCIGSSTCYQATFNINGLNQNEEKANINVHCISESSCSNMEINAANSDQLNLHCDDEWSCGSLVVYCPYHRVGACNIDCSPYDYSCYEMDIIVESTYIDNYLEIVCPPKQFETITSCDYLDIICSDHHKSLLIWDYTQNRWGCGLDTGSSYCCPFLIGTTMSPIPTAPMPTISPMTITTSITSTIPIPITTSTTSATSTTTTSTTTTSTTTSTTTAILTTMGTDANAEFEHGGNNNTDNDNNIDIIIIIIIVFSLLFVIMIGVVIFYFQKLINKIQVLQKNPFVMEENKSKNHAAIEMHKHLVDDKNEQVPAQEGKGNNFTRNIDPQNEDEKEQINNEIVDSNIDNQVVQEINGTVIGDNENMSDLL
eukprot:342686_1